MIYQFIFILFFVNIVLSLRCKRAWPPNCFYNSTCSFNTTECNSSGASNLRGGYYCATIFKNTDQSIIIGTMDCIYDQEATKTCKNQTQCIMKYTNKDKNYLHCCCDEDFCNLNFILTNSSDIDSTTTTEKPPSSSSSSSLCEIIPCYLIFIILSIVILLIILFILICFHKNNKFLKSPIKLCHLFQRRSIGEKHSSDIEKVSENGPLLIPSRTEINSNFIIVEKLLKSGRFSTVHKGFYNNEHVAIKIYDLQTQSNQLFQHEKLIYCLPFMEHNNILKFYGYSQSNENSMLITELSVYGSLRDVLRSRPIKDENELLFICKEISNGVHYLHTDFRKKSSNERNSRGPIAHRDLKPENILYLNENRLVICDFAISIEIDQHEIFNNEQQQQIGTPRYMSPEILAGVIGRETDALLKCDVYSVGIIFWEILSRYSNQDLNVRCEMPYEKQLIEKGYKEIAQLNDMSNIMQLEPPLNRPIINPSWKISSNRSIKEILFTIEQCWDQNPDGRINAALVARRIQQLYQ